MNQQELKASARFIRICIPVCIPFDIDLRTHRVTSWKKGMRGLEIHQKVVDMGIYILLNENQQEIYRIEGYVPNDFLPEKDGYGDYLTLSISDDGIVDNWYDNPDYQEFIEQGFSVLPITSAENIERVIDTFLRPLGRELSEQIAQIKLQPFVLTQVQLELSVKTDEEQSTYPLDNNIQWDKNNASYCEILPSVKSLWINLIASHPKIYRSPVSYINIWTHIELTSQGIFINKLDKTYAYDSLPDGSVRQSLVDCFVSRYTEAISGRQSVREEL